MSRAIPSLIVLALLGASAAPLRAAPDDTVSTALGAQLDSVLRAAARRGFSGVVRVERAGTLLLRKG